MYSKEYLIAKVTYLEGQLNKLPIVTLGKNNGYDVANVYITGKNRKRHRLNTKRGQTYLDIYRTRETLEKELKLLLSNHSFLKCAKRVSIKPVKLIPYSMKKHLVPDSNPQPKTGDYWYNGTQMRSRLELITAGVIDSLGLEFMYEPGIKINNTLYYPDFVVFLPELGCGFIIECLGATEDLNYLHRNYGKLIDYINIDFQPNINYLLFCGRTDFVPDPFNMKVDIVNLINNLARKLVA